MKLTKSKLKQIIKEEIGCLFERRGKHARRRMEKAVQAGIPLTPEQQKKRQDQFMQSRVDRGMPIPMNRDKKLMAHWERVKETLNTFIKAMEESPMGPQTYEANQVRKFMEDFPRHFGMVQREDHAGLGSEPVYDTGEQSGQAFKATDVYEPLEDVPGASGETMSALNYFREAKTK